MSLKFLVAMRVEEWRLVLAAETHLHEAVSAPLDQGLCDQEGASVSMLQMRARERQRRGQEQEGEALNGTANATPIVANSTDSLRVQPSTGSSPHGPTMGEPPDARHGRLVVTLLVQTTACLRRGRALVQTAVQHVDETSMVLVFLLLALTVGSVYCIVQSGKTEIQNRAFQDRFLAPLCQGLVVQGKEPLVCRVDCKFWHDRQQVSFLIADTEGAGVAVACADEISAARGLIYLESLDGAQMLACAATDGIYGDNVLAPALPVFQGQAPPVPPSVPTATLPPPEAVRTGSSRADLAKQRQQQLLQTQLQQASAGSYGVLQRTKRDEYTLTRMDKDFVTFRAGPAGFRGHSIDVLSGRGRKVASAVPIHEGEMDEQGEIFHPRYQVSISPWVDSGLVLLGLLAIDKCERPPPPLPPPMTPEPSRCGRCMDSLTGSGGGYYPASQATFTTPDLM